MPSSKERRRIEVPTPLYERLKHIAESEERPITSVLWELVQVGLTNYRPTWLPHFFRERFNEQARRVLELAKEEAEQLHHSSIGTEHLLLGLLRENEGIAAQVLRQLWVDLEKTRKALAYIMSKKQTFAPKVPVPPEDAEISYTPRARKVLALAVDEAQRLGHDYVGTEHLLLALVKEGEGLAAGLLQTFGALGKVREFTLAQINQDASAAAPTQEPESHQG